MKEYFDKIYKGTKQEFYKIVEENLKQDKKMFIITANPETIMKAEENTKMKEAYLSSESTVIADGIGILKGAKMLGYNICETIPGVELSTALLQYANTHKKAIYLLGAKPEVLEKLVQRIKKEYKNVQILGTTDGYVKDKESTFRKIAKLNPDIILVALGIPMQEILIFEHLKQFSKGIFVGVGGTFDVLSGTKRRAPQIFIKLKLEWLYRITREPKRIKRFINSNIKYLMRINKEKRNKHD